MQTIVQVKISDLGQEIVDRIKTTTTFSTKGFSIFNMDDLDELVKSQVQLPIAGVAYEGGLPLENEASGRRTATGAQRVIKFTVSFSVIIAVNYNIMGMSDTDSKVTAMDLLHEVRQVVLGYSGVNQNPWVLVREQPIDGPSGSNSTGIIYYGQLWSTDINLSGNFTET